MKIPGQCDVVVIGGGPAGSTAATLLSQKGYHVVLLERQQHPRFMVGESLIPHFWKYADATGAAPKIQAEGFIQKAGGTVVWNGVIRQLRFRDFGHTRPALHVERDRFDHILLTHAREQRTQVFENVTALKADLSDEQVRVTYRPADESTPAEIACRFVLDASGQSALIARQLGIRVMDEGFRFMSVWGYFNNSKYVAADGRAYPFEHLRSIPPTTFVTSLGEPGEWGWAWHIPLRESTSVGLVLPIEKMKAIKSDEGLEAYFLRTCHQTPYLSRLLEPARYLEGSFHVIRDYSYRPTQLAGPGFFLIGDAAAFVDPVYSQGVTVAMYEAYLAAWAVHRSLKDPAQTARNRAIFSSHLMGRLVVVRSLALPRYPVSQEASDLAKQIIQFQSAEEQELMYVASTAATRNENFLAMTQRADGAGIVSTRFRVLDEIAF